MTTLSIRGGLSAFTGQPLDLDLVAGRIAAAGRLGPPPPDAALADAAGQLVSPALVEPHYHLASCLMPNEVRNLSFEDSLQEYGRVKCDRYTAEDVHDRAVAMGRLMAARGVTSLRTFADLDPYSGTRVLEGILAARATLAPLLDLRIVAFAQHGLLHDPAVIPLLKQGLQAGAVAVGVNPQLEGQDDRARQAIRAAFDLAREFDVDLDFHCDEGDRIDSFLLEAVARETLARGYSSRVTVAHCHSLPKQPQPYRRMIYDLLLEADIAVASSPLSMAVAGAGLADPPRGITSVREMLHAGIKVAIAQECFASMWVKHLAYPDPVMSLQAMAYGAQLYTAEDLCLAWSMITTSAAAMLRLPDYGLAPGDRADLLLLHAVSPADAVTRLAPSRTVIKGGNIIARSCYNETIHG